MSRQTHWHFASQDLSLIDCRDRVAFALGSNLGDRRALLGRALCRLAERFGALRVAPFYTTAAVSEIPQDDYLNTVALATLPSMSASSEEQVRRALGFTKKLEADAGRVDERRNSPRPLDIDILLWGDLRAQYPSLDDDLDDNPGSGEPGGRQWQGAIEIPHPRMTERLFVLAPLHDLAPNLRLPDGRVVVDLLPEVADQRADRLEAGETSAPPAGSPSVEPSSEV